MRTGHRRSVVSIGLLTLVLVACPIGASAASARIRDCEKGGGLLSTVTDGLCTLVDKGTAAVDDLTGGALTPVTKGVEESTGEVLGTVGGVVPTATPRGAGPPPTESPDPTPAPTNADQDCRLRAACAHPSGHQAPVGRQSPSPPSPSPTPAEHRRPETRHVPVAPLPPERRPQLIEPLDPVTPEPGHEEHGPLQVPPLLPAPFSEDLAVRVPGHEPIRPRPMSGDVLGTTLTAILLGSAVLAARVVQRRRGRHEQGASIPFEPAPGGGRQRTGLSTPA